MYRGHIPGYYFDTQKKKYFKIVPNHAGGRFSSGTVSKIEKEKQEARLQKKQAKAVKTQLIQRNPLLSAPLAGGSFLRRETAQHSNHASVSEEHVQAYGSGLDPTWSWRFLQEVSTFTYDPVTEGFLVGTRCGSGHSNLIVFEPAHHAHHSDQPWRIVEAFASADISSISISPSRSVALTGTGGPRAMVSFITLAEPEMTDGQIDCDMSVSFVFSSETTAWSSAANPFIHDQSMFVVGMSDAAMQFSNVEGGWEDINFETTDSDVMAVEWLTPTVACLGLRNGSIKLWDVRSKGSATRLQHPSRITGIRRADDHSLVACGLQSSLALYDLRMPIMTETNSPSPKRRNKSGHHTPARNLTQPLLRFSHRNESNRPLGLDLDSDNMLVAAGNDRSGIDLFSLSTGEKISGNRRIQQHLYQQYPSRVPKASNETGTEIVDDHFMRNLQFCRNADHQSSEPFLAGTSLDTLYALGWHVS